jgi:anti-anti-sigma regulatory factor
MSQHRLPEQLDIRRIGDVHRELLGATAASGGAEPRRRRKTKNGRCVDAGAVTRIDTAGVQWLAAMLNERSDVSITLANPTPCLLQAFEALGLAHLLNSDKVIRHGKNSRGR